MELKEYNYPAFCVISAVLKTEDDIQIKKLYKALPKQFQYAAELFGWNNEDMKVEIEEWIKANDYS